MRNSVLVGLAVISLSFSFKHPMHVSVTDIEIDREDKAIKIVTHIFLDDIEKSFQNARGNHDLDVTKASVKVDFDNYLEKYMLAVLQLSVNDKPVEVDYLGYEIEGSGLWCYMEVLKVKNVRTLEIRNNILLNTFDDQTNLVHVEYNKKIRSAKMDKGTTSYVFEIEE